MKNFLIIFCLSINFANGQSISRCRDRFSSYLNFRGSLNGMVRFEEDAIYLLGPSGKKEFAIYKEEISILADFFENSTVTEQEKFFRSKGLRRLSKQMRDSLAMATDTRKIPVAAINELPLKGLKIAIDAGHFGTTLAEAQVEQKFLFFVKDQKSPTDTIKLFESSLTFNTARILQHLLEGQGATTFLTRTEANYTSFNCTFADWMKHQRKRTLDSLLNERSMTPQKYARLKKCNEYQFFWDFFRDYDLANRANKVNMFDPHLTLIIHYNVDEKNAPWKTHTKKNFTMVFIAGGFTAKDLQRGENKMHFLRLLLTDQLERSESLGKETVNRFNKNLGIPIASSTDATYLAQNCIPTSSRGVYCRNLVLCRKINSPLVYGESLYQDNENESATLMKSDLDHYGIKTNERLKKVATSYYEAVMAFLER